MATWTDLATAVAALPETVPGTAYGHRAWRIRKKLLAWERPLRSADRAALGAAAPDGDIIGLPTADEAEVGELIAAFPTVFFTTPHFTGTRVVLARLAPLPVDLLQHLLTEAWRRHAPKRLVARFDTLRAAPSDAPT